MSKQIEDKKKGIIDEINLLNLRKMIVSEKIEELLIEEVEIVNKINELTIKYQSLK